MKQFILLASLLSACYSTNSGLIRLERITWSLPPNALSGFVEAEYITASEFEGQVRWFKEATQIRSEAEIEPPINDPLLDSVDDTDSTWGNATLEWEPQYHLWIFNNQKHGITASKWQDGDGVHHSSRINFSPVPVEYGALSVGFFGSGVYHYFHPDIFRPNASSSEKGGLSGNIELLKKPIRYLRASGGEFKLHTTIKAKGHIEYHSVDKVKDVVKFEEVQESNVEVEEYTRDGFFVRSVDAVLPTSYPSGIEGEYNTMFVQNGEMIQVVTQVLPDDPIIEYVYQNNTVIYVDACNYMSQVRESQEDGIQYFKLDVGWENCMYFTVNGYPNPTVQLFRDGAPLNSSLGPNESVTSLMLAKDKLQTILLMEPVDERVAGRYKCVAKADGSEEVSHEFMVEVNSGA